MITIYYYLNGRRFCFGPLLLTFLMCLFLVLYSKHKKELHDNPNHPHLSTIQREDPFAKLFLRLRVTRRLPPRQTAFLCTRSSAPKPPCTPAKEWVCVFANGRFLMQDCRNKIKKAGKTKGKTQGKQCVCKQKVKRTTEIPTQGLCY